MTTTIRNNREKVIEASNFINDNLVSSYIGTKGNNSYYNVNGIIWEIWQDGCGNYPTTNNISVENFSL